jgi:hypothetical protein
MNNELRIVIVPQEDDPGFYTIDFFDKIGHILHFRDESLRAYRALSLEGYARLDLRLTPDEKIFFLEANPNPHLARDEDFALSAKKFGISYEDLIQKIIELGLEKNN